MSAKDRYRKLFGEVAREKGYIGEEHLEEALELQKERRAVGKKDKLLGQILLELGYMNIEQIQDVIEVVYPAR